MPVHLVSEKNDCCCVFYCFIAAPTAAPSGPSGAPSVAPTKAPPVVGWLYANFYKGGYVDSNIIAVEGFVTNRCQQEHYGSYYFGSEMYTCSAINGKIMLCDLILSLWTRRYFELHVLG